MASWEADQAALHALVATYCICADNGDCDRFGSLFTADAVIVSPAATLTGIEQIRPIPDILRQMFVRTLHTLVDLDVTGLEGDSATGVTRSFAHHVERAADGRHSIDKWMSRYLDRFTRQDGTWKIAYREQIVDWTERVAITPGPGLTRG